LTPRTPSRWLWRYLWGWTLLVLALTWTGLAGVGYSTGLHEAQEITDGHLKATGDLLMRVKELGLTPPPSQLKRPADPDTPERYAADLRVVAWENGELTWDTHAMADRLPPTLVDGYHTLVLAGGPEVVTWRLFVVTQAPAAGPSRRVAVITDTARHAALALDMAEHIVRPAIVLFPLTALLLIWAIRRGLRPLHQLSSDMATLDVRAGQRLRSEQAFVELDSTVQAIHHLVDQLQHQWARERQFNADVAHELRTPLTSAVLQAHLAQAADSPAQREAALKRVEAEALRAANILTQLLELAQAQRSGSRPDDTVDLGTLAQEVCAAHAGMAHERGQTLSLRVPDGRVCVQGHADLLRLAVRNLVDNALRHTPSGTQVDIEVAQTSDGAVTLSVTDSGGAVPLAGARPGMGVGLTLVQRIADAQGADFQRDTTQQAQGRRYVLRWPKAVPR